MGKLCKCTAGGENLGKSPCSPILQSVAKMLFKERLDSGGAVAEVDFSGEINEAFWNALIKATPMRNRYLLADGVDEWTWEQQEAENVESANNVQYKVRDGHTEISFVIYESTFKQYDSFKALECLKLGVLMVDEAGQVAGLGRDDEKMRLIPIDSLRVRKTVTQNSGEVAHILITFRIPHQFNIGDIRIWIPEGEDFNPLELLPISDVIASDLAATATSDIVTFKLGHDSTKLGFDPFVGVGKDDITITVDGTAATITTLTETSDGVYSALLSAAVASSEVVAITEITANAFELKEVISITVD